MITLDEHMAYAFALRINYVYSGNCVDPFRAALQIGVTSVIMSKCTEAKSVDRD